MLENPGFTSLAAVMIVLMIFGVYALIKMKKYDKQLDADKEARKASREKSAHAG